MMKGILNFFGFVHKSELVVLANKLTKMRRIIISQREDRLKLFFNHNLSKPEIEYREFIGSDSRYNKETFDEWYQKYRRDEYSAYKLRCLSLHPHLLHVFMVEVSKFDWEDIRSFMEKHNWNWTKNRPLEIDDLVDCVITLIPTKSFDYQCNGISSGGFTVELYYKKDGSPYCKIYFKKELVYTL